MAYGDPYFFQGAVRATLSRRGFDLLRQRRSTGIRFRRRARGNAQYDPSQVLVIDPILSYSTYLGGKSEDIGWDIAVDPDGSAYVAGETVSVLTNLITLGAFETHYPGGFGGNAFVAKLNPAGSALV